MSIKLTLQICELQKNSTQEKSADIWQHVRLDGLFQNLKKVTWDFSYILEISCIK